MDLQDCTKFATENPVCYVATMDGDQPRVRGFLMWYADESGFYFITFSPKAVHEQLQKNPKVEVCFYNNPPELGDAKQMRVTGQAEFLDDEEVREKAYENRSFLDPMAGQSVRPFTRAFRISTGEAHFWTLADVLKEPELERVKF
jgi:pyridoxamine 5'-phosphate oxidase